MENIFKYLKYVSNDSEFYQKPSKNIIDFEVNGLDNNWFVDTNDDFWIFYSFFREDTIQGWKIHISTPIENAEETLNIVSKILIDLKVSFKHVRSKRNLFEMYSKHGNRISSGKFITIYPNKDIFTHLMNTLHDALKNIPKGPYILSDKRWKDGNVYFRYGAFKSIKNKDGVLCIYDNNGNLIEDVRKPNFHLPSFVEMPKEIIDTEKDFFKSNIKTENRLKLYTIEKVIRFSNSGGIYVANRKSDGKKVIIKEARYNIGIDGTGKNAMQRLENEYNSLVKLQKVDEVINVLDYFKVWENQFLVIDFADGVSLYTWIASNYPYIETENTDDYFKKVKIITENLENIITKMHLENVAMCDLQHQNIFIDEDNNLKITLIDFEGAEPSENESIPSLATRGFSDANIIIAKERDWYSLNRIVQFCLLPIGAVYDMDMSINEKHCLWIYKNFGKEAYEYFYNFQMRNNSKISISNEIFKDTYSKANTKIKSLNEDINKINIDSMLEKLVFSLNENLNENTESLINGDIRQFETDLGMLNIQNGGFGVALALFRIGKVSQNIYNWIEKQIKNFENNHYNNGLLTGISGISCVLYELGYIKEAKKLLEKVSRYEESLKDLSLRSGLSGIGIAMLSFYDNTKDDLYLAEAKKIADLIINSYDSNIERTNLDWESAGIGLLDGDSGISLFLSLFYKITDNKYYLENSLKFLKRDIDSLKINEINEMIQLYNENLKRSFSFLNSGSIGVYIAIHMLNKICKANYFEKEIQGILKISETRITMEANLYDGLCSFMFLNCINGIDDNFLNRTLEKLDMFLIPKRDGLIMPGKSFYKFSLDFHTGNSGAILSILSAKNKNPLLWLPLSKGLLNIL